ncbi:MAG TPA: hypothetical protein VJR27_04765 [Candidatus Saccharimonadales bacterium]|nr:hypothetical protein [Candidatus Saccharimonadales bacterium]
MDKQADHQYALYGRRVQADLQAYAKQLRSTTEQQYGAAVAREIEQFLAVLLEQNLLPGILVLTGYTLAGGQDQAMATRAARAVAMFHAVVSMQQGPAGLQNAARAGEHAAQILLANLEVDAEANRRAVSIMNRTLLLTAHAQAEQRHNPGSPQILEWQALERAVNPLHVGMVLAGADCHATDAITPLATELGKAIVQNGENIEKLLEKILNQPLS